MEDLVGYVDLAAEVGVATNALRAWLDARGLLRTQAEANAIRRKRQRQSGEIVREEIRRRRGDGQEIASIARDMNLSYTTVFRVLKQEGLTRQYGLGRPMAGPRRTSKVEASRRRVLDLVHDGCTSADIAAEIGVSETTLRKWFSANGIERQPVVRFTDLQKRIIETWNTTSLTRAEVSLYLACSRHAVNVALRKAGLVERRPTRGRPPGSKSGVRSPPV